MIVVENISRAFGKVKALSEVSLNIDKGEIYGFIGPDGAGKTTLFRILATLLLADKGSVLISGMNVVKDYKRIRSILGYMPGRFSLYQDLTVEENLKFYATIFGTTIQKNYDLIKDIYQHIEPFKDRYAAKLSGGMKQKLALCCALIHKPEILILDEPTTGVDAVSRKEFWEMLKKLKNEEITILVSTPYMDEARLCDSVALIQNGKILSINTPGEIINDFSGILVEIKSKDLYMLKKSILKFKKTKKAYLSGQKVHFTSWDKQPDLNEIMYWLKENGHENVEINIAEPTIEDCFMELMDHTDE